MPRTIPPILALLAFAGCGGPAPQAQNASQPSQPAIVIANPYQQQLLELNETDRMLSLRRGIQDDDESCPRITGSRFQQTFKGMAMWIAYCSNRTWAVFVDPQGNVQARPCDHAAELGIPACVVTPPPGAGGAARSGETVRPPAAGKH